MFDRLLYCDSEDAANMIPIDPKRKAHQIAANYFDVTVNEDGEPMVTYLPDKLTEKKDPRESWWECAEREEIKPGRFVRRLFKEETLRQYGVNDAELERFANYVKTSRGGTVTVQEVSGRDIVKWYNERKYAPGGGSLNNSCMRHEQCESYTQMYADHPNCSLAIMVNDDGQLVARALVWRGVKAKNQNTRKVRTITFMDRVYTQLDHYAPLMTAWAASVGYFYKEVQDSSSTNQLVSPQGKAYRFHLSLPSEVEEKLDYYPYMDTLYCLSPDFKLLTNYFVRSKSGEVYQMRSVEGDLSGYSNHAGQTWTQLNGWVRDMHLATCPRCHRQGDRRMFHRLQSYRNRTFTGCEACVSRHYIHSPHLNRYIARRTAVNTRTLGWVTPAVARREAERVARVLEERAATAAAGAEQLPTTTATVGSTSGGTLVRDMSGQVVTIDVTPIPYTANSAWDAEYPPYTTMSAQRRNVRQEIEMEMQAAATQRRLQAMADAERVNRYWDVAEPELAPIPAPPAFDTPILPERLADHPVPGVVRRAGVYAISATFTDLGTGVAVATWRYMDRNGVEREYQMAVSSDELYNSGPQHSHSEYELRRVQGELGIERPQLSEREATIEQTQTNGEPEPEPEPQTVFDHTYRTW
jgi:hypothetical protein